MDATKGSSRFSSAKPRVTIVTPSYNQGQFVERTILSVLRQDYPNIEYIFADAMSTDKTVELLNTYSNQITKIVREKDDGQSDALNKSFNFATGEILAYLNTDDCFANASVVSHAVNYLLTHDDVDLVYGRRQYIDLNGFLNLSNPFRPFNKEQLYKADYIGQECCFWTKDIYKRSGDMVNVDYKFAMDYELWFRFLDHGANFHAVDELYGLFRWYEDQKSRAIFESVGLPEIAKLQKQYLGYAMEPKKMFALFEEHFAGVDRGEFPEIAGIYDVVWRLETHLKRMVIGRAPLDHWVFMNQRAVV